MSSATPCHKFSCITVSKGRLHHIQQTLPLMSALEPDEIVVVDYGCPQKTGDWVATHFKHVKVVRVDDDDGFCATRARNIGARHATHPWLCFLDADIKVQPGFLNWLKANVHPKFFYRHALLNGVRDPETWGSFVCPRSAFDGVEGYDEIYRGWGGEDEDLFYRLKRSGLAQDHFPNELITAISHSNTERVAFGAIKNKSVQGIINHCYMYAKMQMMEFGNVDTELPLETRKRIADKVNLAFEGWLKDPSLPYPSVNFSLKGGNVFDKDYLLSRHCSLTFSFADALATAGHRPNV